MILSYSRNSFRVLHHIPNIISPITRLITLPFLSSINPSSIPISQRYDRRPVLRPGDRGVHPGGAVPSLQPALTTFHLRTPTEGKLTMSGRTHDAAGRELLQKNPAADTVKQQRMGAPTCRHRTSPLRQAFLVDRRRE